MELPSIQDYLDALGNPISEKGNSLTQFGRNALLVEYLPDMKLPGFARGFFTSTIHKNTSNWAIYLDGNDGKVSYYNRSAHYYFIRCVIRDGII